MHQTLLSKKVTQFKGLIFMAIAEWQKTYGIKGYEKSGEALAAMHVKKGISNYGRGSHQMLQQPQMLLEHSSSAPQKVKLGCKEFFFLDLGVLILFY